MSGEVDPRHGQFLQVDRLRGRAALHSGPMAGPQRGRGGVSVFEIDVGGERLVVVSSPATGEGAPAELTAAEWEIATAALEGLSNAAIAARRGRSPRTVANQLASIYRKLRVASRAELAARLLGGR
jgi:DNA-binding CsgD family transcriptional regulator